MISYYDILGIPETATADEIKSAYRELAKKLHPDMDKSKGASARFRLVKEAYETLSNSGKRAAYDATLGKSTAGTGGGSTSSSPPPPSRPPVIRVSKTALEFTVFAGRKDSASFVVENVGGPITTYEIGWQGIPDWVEAGVETTPRSTFPITVTVSILETIPEGHYEDAILVVVDGTVQGTVRVTAAVVSFPVHAPRTAPIYVPPAPSAPSAPVPTPPAPPTPAFPWMAVLLIVILMLLVSAVTSGSSQMSPKNTPVEQIKSVPTVDEQQNEVQLSLSNPKSILSGGRMGLADCSGMINPNSYWGEEYCRHKWGKYQFTNNARYLTLKVGTPYMYCKYKGGGDFDFPKELHPGESLILYCREFTPWNTPQDVRTQMYLIREDKSVVLLVGHTNNQIEICWNC